MFTSCKPSKSADDDIKMKMILPFEMRFYFGTTDFKFFLGAGLQYNFIYTGKYEVSSGYSYGYYDYWGNYYQYNYGGSKKYKETTSAHQLSGNGSAGFSILGMQYKVHILLGVKFHFPIVNNAEGVEYSNGGRFDFSKDKTSIAATAGLSFNCGERCVIMLNYDYPLGATKQNSFESVDKRNFFQTHSQSITMSIMWRIGGDD